jgi:hypothetical protein
MSKNRHIRPLISFKKCNPKLYNLLLKESLPGLEGQSKKDQENNSYYIYAWHFSGIKSIDKTLSGYEQYNPFFFDTSGSLKLTHKTIVSELGRLLLTGWYYNIEDWAKEICGYVYNSYLTKKEQFNEYKFTEVIKSIKENVGYYYHRPDELKLYILENFFKDELKKMLPEPPKKLQSHDEAVEFLMGMDKNLLKKNKNHYKERAMYLEDYTMYLEELIENAGMIVNEDEFKKDWERQNVEYCKEIADMRQQYRQQILKQLPACLYKELLSKTKD